METLLSTLPKFRNFGKVLTLILFTLAGALHATPQQHTATDTPKTGTYITKHSNGKIAEKGYLKNGEKHRIWSFYNQNGAITQKEKWKNGKLQWQVFYNERGRIIKTIDKNGKEKELSGCGC